METQASTPTLKLVREFRSSPEKVWAAWTTPEALKRWLSPSEAFTIPVAEVDLRIGGGFRVLMRSPDGKDHDASGVYRVIEPHRRLEFTWIWKSRPEHESLVLLELEAIATGTRFTMTHSQLFDQESVQDHAKGWKGCLDHLGQYVDPAPVTTH